MIAPDFHARRRLLGGSLATVGGLLLSGCAASGTGRSAAPIPEGQPYALPGAWHVDLDHHGTRHRVFLCCPETPPPVGGYPVLYVLDGNALFPLLAQQMRLLAARPESEPIDPPLIVGLGYPGDAPYDQDARAADYTLAPRRLGGIERPGAAHFLDFIAQRVDPLVRERHPVDRTRTTLLGHSYGGLFTLYALFARTPLFQHFVAASPSLWWGDGALLPLRDDYLAAMAEAPAAGAPRSLLITVGELEERSPSASPSSQARSPRAQRQARRRLVSNARAMAHSLQGLAALHTSFRLIPDADHGGVILPTSALALGLAAKVPT